MILIKAWLAFYLIHRLTPTDYGFYAVVISSLGIWIALSDLGWGDFLRRELPALQTPLRILYLKMASTLQIIWMIVLLTGIYFLWKEQILFRFSDFRLPPSLFVCAAFLFLMAGHFPLLQIYLNYSKRIEDFNRIILIQMASWAALLFIIATWRNVRLDLREVLWTWLASYLFSYGYFLLKNRVPLWGLEKIVFVRESLKYGFPLALAETAKKVFQYYDRYWLGAAASLADVSLYHFFNSFFDIAERANLVTLYPYIFDAHDQSQLHRRNRLITSLLKTRFLFHLLGIGVAALILYFFPDILPPAYRSQMSLFFIIGGVSLIRLFNLSAVLGLLLEKKTQAIAFSYLFGLAVSLPLNMLLTPRFGSYGVAWSLLLSTASVTLFQIRLVRVQRYIIFKELFSLVPEWELIKQWWETRPIFKKGLKKRRCLPSSGSNAPNF